MQPLVLVKEDNNTYEVLDGQQRLTSFLILYKALYSDDLPYTLKYEKEVNQFKYIKNLKYMLVKDYEKVIKCDINI